MFVFIVLTTFLVHQHSHKSPDADYETEATLRRIEAKLDCAPEKERLGRRARKVVRTMNTNTCRNSDCQFSNVA